MEIEEHPFKRWLWMHRLSGNAFAELAKMHPNTIHKAMRGEHMRIDTVKRIIRHTDKDLTLADFGY